MTIRRNPSTSLEGFEVIENTTKLPSNYPKIVLSCPHAQCDIHPDDYKEHYCDWVAEDALNGILDRIGEIPSVISIIGRDERLEHDLNRNRSRHRPFRKKLESILNPGDIHIDVHSYPDTDKSDDWYEYDMVLFHHDDEQLTALLSEYLKKAGYTVKVMPGDSINDIAVHGTEIGAASCLVEFNSALKDSGRMQGACDAVCHAILDCYEGVCNGW